MRKIYLPGSSWILLSQSGKLFTIKLGWPYEVIRAAALPPSSHSLHYYFLRSRLDFRLKEIKKCIISRINCFRDLTPVCHDPGCFFRRFHFNSQFKLYTGPLLMGWLLCVGPHKYV